MSTNFDFNKNKCWSCEYFCGKRQYKKGLLLGDSVETESSGTCSNKRSNYYNKKIGEKDWCSKYQKWGVLQSALEREKLRQQQLQMQMESKKSQGQQQHKVAPTPVSRCDATDSNAYDYGTDTPENRQESLEEQLQREERLKEYKKQRDEQNEIKSKKRSFWIGIVAAVVLTIIIVVSVLSVEP